MGRTLALAFPILLLLASAPTASANHPSPAPHEPDVCFSHDDNPGYYECSVGIWLSPFRVCRIYLYNKETGQEEKCSL